MSIIDQTKSKVYEKFDQSNGSEANVHKNLNHSNQRKSEIRKDPVNLKFYTWQAFQCITLTILYDEYI